MKKIYLLISILLSLKGADAQQHILLQFSSQQNIPQVKPSNTGKGYTITSTDKRLNNLFTQYNITSLRKEYPDAHLVRHPNAEKLDRVYRIECTKGINDLYKELQEGNFSTVEKDIYLVQTPQTLTDPNDNNLICYGGGCVTRCSSFQNDLINASGAWNITTGDSTVRIAILDEEFLRTQEELVGKIGTDLALSTYSGGYSHGTAVAEIAAGGTNNGVGIASIGYNCKMDLYDMDMNSILVAAMNGAKVVNISWLQSCYYICYDQCLINMVHDTYQTVIVAAAGNGATGNGCGGTGYVYPASYDHVISVSTVGHYYDISTFPTTCNSFNYKDVHDQYPGQPLYSYTHNDSVDLCAPGYQIISARTDAVNGLPNNNHGSNWGTSFSAPMVAGLAGLILSVNPNLRAGDVEMILKCTAKDIYDIPFNMPYLNMLGAGRIDAGAAVALAQTWTPGTDTLIHGNAPIGIYWTGILSLGKDTIFNFPDNTPIGDTACNIGYGLKVVSADMSQTFKWIVTYTDQSNQIVSHSILYGDSITISRGVDYPFINDGGILTVAVRGNDCPRTIYHIEYRDSSSLGTSCMYSCPADITITGTYSDALTESYTWIKSSGQTTILDTVPVKLDSHPIGGYIEFAPATTSDFFLAAPSTDSAEFIAQAYNGCILGEPSFAKNIFSKVEAVRSKAIDEENSKGFAVYPNPTTGIVTVLHPNKRGIIEISDTYGNRIMQKQYEGSTETTIDLHALASGIYILRIVNTNFVNRIIKQ